MFAHGAGVEQDEVGLLERIGQAEADILQNAADLFAVVDVLLAAEAVDVGHGRRVRVNGCDDGGGRRIVGIGQLFQNSPSGCSFDKWAHAQIYCYSIQQRRKMHKMPAAQNLAQQNRSPPYNYTGACAAPAASPL